MSGTRGGRRQRQWDLRAAGNFIGGGSGAGLLLAAALEGITGGTFRLTLALGLLLIGAGLGLVWLEIGRPWRALNVFFHPRTSWMTREGIMALLLFPLGLAAVATGSAALAAAAALAGLAFLGCQAGILHAARAIPAWRKPELVALIVAGGLAEGTGLALVVAESARWPVLLALAAGAAREVAWRRYRVALGRDGRTAPALAAFTAGPARLARLGQVASLVLLAVGAALPPAFGPMGPVLAGVGGVLAFLGGAAIKAVLVTRAGYTGKLTLPAVPVRGGGGPARQAAAR
ncbi:MAG: phenylacetyl CoA [Rhodospirillales bacterium]|nr:phenylacetyl CoA [Rhodospirillales bacterium]